MQTANEGQRTFWTSQFGQKWVTFEDELERLHGAMTGPLLDKAVIAPGHRVLDIGCGSGAVSRAAALRAGPEGAVTGIDISDVILATARDAAVQPGAAALTYVEADAQTHDFAEAAFDRLVSRMGVMFFDAPEVAFANLRRAAAPGARYAAVAWRRGPENPWFGIPGAVAMRHLGPLETDPDAPGPMAFANIDRACGLLEAGGWEDVAADPLSLHLAMEGTAAEASEMFTTLGSAARVIEAHGATPEQIRAITEDIAAEMAKWDTPEGLRVPVTMTLFSAQAPG